MSTFSQGNLNVVVDAVDGAVQVRFTGESDDLQPSRALEPIVSAVVAKGSGMDVSISFVGLSYMNSATVTPLMRLIERLSTSARSVRVTYRESVQWQATSFRAMRVVARRWRNVEVVGE